MVVFGQTVVKAERVHGGDSFCATNVPLTSFDVGQLPHFYRAILQEIVENVQVHRSEEGIAVIPSEIGSMYMRLSGIKLCDVKHNLKNSRKLFGTKCGVLVVFSRKVRMLVESGRRR